MRVVVDQVKQLDTIDADSGLADLTYHLNRWAEAQPADDSWKPDPMIDRLPKAIREMLPAERLTKMQFDPRDGRHLWTAGWFRSIGEWVVERQQPDARLAAALRRREPAMNKDRVEQLLIAERLFDWTVRNIQLDPLLPYVIEATAGPTAIKPGDTTAPAVPPYLRGIPGPGYQREPWLTLVMGHGDSFDRSRIFIQLCRQQGIAVVMLAIFDVKTSNRPQPWAPAVLLDDQLFLFDMGIGLPLPGPGEQPIATLADLKAHPELLESLDLDTERKYPVRGADLESLVALLDAGSLTLSRRHQLLESQLVGGDQVVLATKPSQLAERVRKVPGMNNVLLWSTPWETELFRATLERMQRESPPPEIQMRLAEEQFYQQPQPLVKGRHMHFRGLFANQDDVTGAKGYYLQSRLPDDVIDQLLTSDSAQKQIGLVRGQFETDNGWQNRLRTAQIFSREAKFNASYWMGLVHYDGNQPDVAAEWFKNRTLDLPQRNRWKAGARYNLARCYERLGKLSEARQLLEEDDSPQVYGNKLRARRLAAAAASPTAPSNPTAPAGTPSAPSTPAATPAAAAPEPSSSPKP